MLSIASPGAERRRQQRDAALAPGSRLLPASGVAFEPTSTARLDETMRELGAFSPHVRSAMEKAREHADAVEALAGRLRAHMAIPLPRVWAPVDGSPSQCEPKPARATHDYPSGRVGGGSVDEADFAAAAADCVRQLRVAVAGPLERWLDALDVAAARLESVERARLGFDAARREAENRFAEDERRAHAAFAALRDPTAAAAAMEMGSGGGGDYGGFGGGGGGGEADQYGRGLLGRRRRGQQQNAGAAAAALFGGGGNGGGRSSAAAMGVGPPPGATSTRGALFVEQARAAELEEAALRRAQHERALQAIRASYEEQERLAFEMLAGLARDTARLKSYYAAALLSAMAGCQRLALALGPAKLPLPGCAAAVGAGEEAATSSSPQQDYGRIGSVERDVLAASPLARELARGRLPQTQAEAGAGVPAQAPGAAGAAAARQAWPVVVRRALATPMAVGADTTLEARAPVPPAAGMMKAAEGAEGRVGGGRGGGAGEAGAAAAGEWMATPEPRGPPTARARSAGPRAAAAVEEGEEGFGGGETTAAAGAAAASPAAAALLHRRPLAAAAEEQAAAPAQLLQQQQQPRREEELEEEEAFVEARSRAWTPASSMAATSDTGGGAATEAVRAQVAGGGVA